MSCPPSLGVVTSVTAIPTPVIVAAQDGAIARMMDMALRLEGYSPKVYTDGQQALAALLENPCVLAILDAHLPTVDGLAICRRVRASSLPIASIPIILLLVQEDADAWHEHWQHLSINAGLFIPFHVRDLLVAVAAALANPS